MLRSYRVHSPSKSESLPDFAALEMWVTIWESERVQSIIS